MTCDTENCHHRHRLPFDFSMRHIRAETCLLFEPCRHCEPLSFCSPSSTLIMKQKGSPIASLCNEMSYHRPEQSHQVDERFSLVGQGDISVDANSLLSFHANFSQNNNGAQQGAFHGRASNLLEPLEDDFEAWCNGEQVDMNATKTSASFSPIVAEENFRSGRSFLVFLSTRFRLTRRSNVRSHVFLPSLHDHCSW